MMRTRIFLSIGFGLVLATPVWAQKADTSYFVTRLGSDTLAVERLIRTPMRAVLDGVSRAPKTRIRHMVIQFDQNGEFAGSESTLRVAGAPADTPPTDKITASIMGDSIMWMKGGSTPGMTNTARALHAVPGTSPFVSAYQLLADMAMRQPGDSLPVNLLAMNAVTKRSFRKLDKEHITFGESGMGPIQVTIDEHGRIKRFLSFGSELGTIAEASPRFDIEEMARRFAALDAQGKGLGELSPRDTARAGFGGTKLTVDYGRPSKRGRPVLGGLVPFGEVWRTGAGNVTQFETTADLMVGEVHVPAGKYVLNVLADKKGWTLIVGKFAGQGGMTYDSAQDVGRTPMQLRTISPPVERFTITVAGEAKKGVLKMNWDTTEASVPIIVH